MRWYLCPWRPKISLLNHKRSPGSDFQLDITSPQVSAAHFVWRKSTDIDDNPRFLNLRVLKAMLTIFSDGRWKECDFLEHFGPPRFDLCLTVCPGISWIRHADCYHYKGSLLLYRNLFRSTISTTATNLSQKLIMIYSKEKTTTPPIFQNQNLQFCRHQTTIHLSNPQNGW